MRCSAFSRAGNPQLRCALDAAGRGYDIDGCRAAGTAAHAPGGLARQEVASMDVYCRVAFSALGGLKERILATIEAICSARAL
jgi:hypothetical protein